MRRYTLSVRHIGHLRQFLFGLSLALLSFDFRDNGSVALINPKGWLLATVLCCALCFLLSILKPGLRNNIILLPALAAAACYIKFSYGLPEFPEMKCLWPILLLAGGCIGFYKPGTKHLAVQQKPQHTIVNINIITQLYDNTSKNDKSDKPGEK